MADQNVNIKISTTADTSGAKAAATALGDIKRQGTQAAGATIDQAKAINTLGEDLDKGAAAGRVFNEVAQGNVRALGQIGPVLKGIAVAFRTNPLFLIGSIAAAVILPALDKIIKGWKSVADEAAASGKIAADAGEKAVESITERRENALAEAYKEIAARAAEARANIDAVALAQNAQIDADEAVAMAQLQADTSLTEVQRQQRTADIRREFRGRRNERELAEIASREQTSAQTVQGTANAIARARENEQRARGFAGSVEAQSPTFIRRQLEQATAAQNELIASSPTTQAGVEERNRKLEEGAQNLSNLRASLADAEANHAQRMATAQAALEAATKARADAEAKAAEAAAEAAEEANLNAARRAAIEIRSAADQRVAEIQAPGALAEAERKDREAQERRAREAQQAQLLTRSQQTASEAETAAGAVVRSNPGLRDNALALRDAARALADGTDASELNQLSQAIAELTAALGTGETPVTRRLQAQIEALKQQVKNLRTR